MMLLEILNICKSFKNESVLQNICLRLDACQTMSILGRSGSGKTTLLKIIAGFLAPDEGTVNLNGQSINSFPPQQRNIVYISQDALLFPHLNIFENIAFGLRIRKKNAHEVNTEVSFIAESLGIADQLYKTPEQLSGGQKQRVCFGRALIIKPPLLLLDEPFGNLDTHTRGEMQELFRKISLDQKISSIFVTHDLKEALMVGDNISFMKNRVLKTYPDKISFIEDSTTGVQQELLFWKSLSL